MRVVSEYPLMLANFSGFVCRLDIESGEIFDSRFTK